MIPSGWRGRSRNHRRLIAPANNTKYTAGAIVALSASPPNGAEFVGWGGDVSSTNPSVNVVVDYDKNVVARYVRCQILQIDSSANGRIDASPAPSCGGIGYRNGATVRVEAIPNAGQQFVRWRGALGGASNPSTITMEADKSIAADFEAIPTPTPIGSPAIPTLLSPST
jgi:hypothetical protein